MSFEDVAKQLDPEVYKRFKDALELGKWPDGRALSKEQKEICLQAVMLYEAAQGKSESERVGYIDREKKKSPCGSDKSGSLEEDLSTVRILH